MTKPALPDIKDFTLRVKICFMTDRAYIHVPSSSVCGNNKNAVRQCKCI